MCWLLPVALSPAMLLPLFPSLLHYLLLPLRRNV